MLNFKPVTEEKALGLLPAGEYSFTVMHAENATSKKGNQMIKLSLEIYDNNGLARYVTDYLMEALAYKLRHFCDTTGLEEKYQQGQFDASDCIGKSGQCKLKVEKTEDYAPKNAVQDYVKNVKPATVNSTGIKTKPHNDAGPEDDFISDDIPF